MNTKRIILTVGILSILIVGSLMTVLSVQKRIPMSTQPIRASEPKVATDPSFKELEKALFSGIPMIPVYPGAMLIGSAETNSPGDYAQGYRIKWKTTATVSEIMQWYVKELKLHGWNIEQPDDPLAVTEQVTPISNNEYMGYLAVEVEGDMQEIVIEIRGT